MLKKKKETRYQIVVRLLSEGWSRRAIADRLHMSRNTVSRTARALEERQISPEALTDSTESEIVRILFGETRREERVLPDFAAVHTALAKPGVTRLALWAEYRDDCIAQGKEYYQYSRFCDLYHEHCERTAVTAPLVHEPGKEIMVDWAGTPLKYWDLSQGRLRALPVFVSVSPFSMYTFVLVCLNMAEDAWIGAHVSMFQFYGGVPPIVTCDNTKTAVIENRPHEDPILNQTYRDMGRYYGFAVLPARPYHPRDKAAVESTVNVATRHVITPLNEMRFSSVDELNEAVLERTVALNQRQFQKREGNREEIFLAKERPLLKPLPPQPYLIPSWHTAKVQKNCHVCVNKHYYSVPHEYVGRAVTVRKDPSTVEIYAGDALVATHAAPQPGSDQKYTTDASHLPLGARMYQDWNAAKFLERAEAWGKASREVFRQIILRHEVEEQAYNTLFAFIGLAKKYSESAVEKACAQVLKETGTPSYKRVHAELKKQADAERAVCGPQKSGRPKPTRKAKNSAEQEVFAITRGNSYYSANTNKENNK